MKMWVKKMDKHGMHLLHRGETVETAVPSQPTGSMGVRGSSGSQDRVVGGAFLVPSPASSAR